MPVVFVVTHKIHRTKICSKTRLGPACDTYEKVLEVVRAGSKCISVSNFSHGSHKDKAKSILRISGK